MGSVRPARRFNARRALADRDLPNRIAPDGGPPCAFALLQRSIARPPHRPAGPKADPTDDASSPGLSRRTTRAGTMDPHVARPPGPAACRVRGLGTPIAASTTVPPDAFRRRSVRRLHPSRPSPRIGRTTSRRSLPSWRCSRRFASPPGGRADAVDCRASIPTRMRSATGSRRTRRVAAFSGFALQSTHPLRPGALLWSQGLPPHALGGVTSSPTCVSGSCGPEGSVGPSRGYRLSWVSSPCDRRGDVPSVVRGGRMDSPHGSRALQAARTDPSPVTDAPASAEAPTRRPPSIGERLSTSS